MSAAIQSAIDTLEQEREVVRARFAQLDAAITALKNISNGTGSAFVPEPPAPSVRRTPQPKPAPAAAEAGDLGARLMEALSKHGPLSTGNLTAKARGSKRPVQLLMAQLASKALVHSTGQRRSQLWHLGAKGSSPKEAESRGRR